MRPNNAVQRTPLHGAADRQRLALKTMDHFENIARTLLEREGDWVRQSFKVNLSSEQKRAIHAKKFSIPRPEIDLLALRLAPAEVIAFEVKSFFDSSGVHLADLAAVHSVPQGKYKLFTCVKYRTIVLDQLRVDLTAQNLIPNSAKIRLGLIAGNARKSDVFGIRQLFAKNNWEFWAPEDVKAKVKKFASEGYENDPAFITTKILER